MKGKALVVIGAGLAYLYGTESGRQNLEKAKTWARTTWEHPEVQKTVHDVEARVTQVVKEQGAALSERVTQAVKDAMAGVQAKTEPADPDEIVVEEDGTVRQPQA